MTFPRLNQQQLLDRLPRWRGYWILVVVLAAALTSAACGGGGQPGPADSTVQKGKATFDRICATCHGRNAEGMPRLGKNLRNNAFTKSKSDAELVEFLKMGRSATDPLNETGVDMPPRGGDPTITDEDLQDVVALLRTF